MKIIDFHIISSPFQQIDFVFCCVLFLKNKVSQTHEKYNCVLLVISSKQLLFNSISQEDTNTK